MSIPVECRSEGREKLGEIILWSSSAFAVTVLYVGTALWLMREEPIVAADNSAPPAIMIELAETPEAVNTEETDISEQVQDSAQSTPAEQVDEPSEEKVEEQPPQPTEPEEVTETEPDKPEPVIEEEQEPVEEELPTFENVEVPLPSVKPKPLQPKKEVVKKEEPKKKPPEKRRQQQQAASQQATKAQAQVTQSNRTAASQSVSGFFSSSMTPARWQSRLMAHLERRKRYPSGAKSRGETGVVYVRFRIDDAGNVLSVSLARSSGYPELDGEVLSLVKRASPVPAPPPGVNKTITAPVKFSRR